MFVTLKKYQSILIAMFGNALETYNVVLYGYFTAIIPPLFFPSTNHKLSAMIAMGTFAISFIMRPLGGIIFGHLGDNFGRKKALILSIIIMSFPTMIIGFLPTYDSIGIYAPIILLLSLFIQGLFRASFYHILVLIVFFRGL